MEQTVEIEEQRLFTNQKLLQLLWPLIIEQALSVLVGMSDTVMVSSVGEAAISGVSLVDMINNLIINIFAALATGGAVVTSQFLGARRREDACRSAGQLVMLSALLGVAVMAFCLGFSHALLRLFFGQIDDDVMSAALTYFFITGLSYPFLALYNAGAAIFRSSGNSAISMRVSVLMNVINVCGNALCVFVLHMGVAGVAVPTLVSRAIGAVHDPAAGHPPRKPRSGQLAGGIQLPAGDGPQHPVHRHPLGHGKQPFSAGACAGGQHDLAVRHRAHLGQRRGQQPGQRGLHRGSAPWVWP